MKTFQCKKSLLAVGLAVGMVSTGALALSGSDSEDFTVNATVLGVVDVANTTTLSFGNIDPSDTVDISAAAPMSFCIYSSTGSANVKVTSQGATNNGYSGSGLLEGSGGAAGSTIAYTLMYKNNNTTQFTNFTWEVSAPLSADHGVQDTPCTSSSLSSYLSGVILKADYANKPAGVYSDTVTIDVTPA